MTGVEFPGDASNVCGRKIATEAEPVKVREAYPGNQSSKGAEARACIAFGAATISLLQTLPMFFGGLFKARGGGLTHNHRVAGLAGEQTRLAELPGEAGYEHAEAGRVAASAIAHIVDMPRRTELFEAVRRNMAGMDGLGAGGLSDRMMLVIRDRENPDVEKWATELGTEGRFNPGKTVDLKPDIQSGVPVWPAQMPWNELPTVSGNRYDNNLAGSRVAVDWNSGTESLHGISYFVRQLRGWDNCAPTHIQINSDRFLF